MSSEIASVFIFVLAAGVFALLSRFPKSRTWEGSLLVVSVGMLLLSLLVSYWYVGMLQR